MRKHFLLTALFGIMSVGLVAMASPSMANSPGIYAPSIERAAGINYVAIHTAADIEYVAFVKDAIGIGQLRTPGAKQTSPGITKQKSNRNYVLAGLTNYHLRC